MNKQDTGVFSIPDGFVRNDGSSSFAAHTGPYYQKITADNKMIRGFRVARIHLNATNFTHGGMLMTFADGAMAATVVHETGRRCVTLKMNSEFLSSAFEGDWIEGHFDVLRTTKTIAFVQGGLVARGKMIFKCDGIFHFVRARS
ncbi:PaaI family thioesterase [Sneathiella sp.]|uniref:PaaI family thioesterase n=1 Tax=Sneathiella sp. TaxID=1964365 RepID=UPI002FE100AE